jgi:hypothetical protein
LAHVPYGTGFVSVQLAWNLNDNFLEQELCNDKLASSCASSSRHGLTTQICNCVDRGLSQDSLSYSFGQELSGILRNWKVNCQV